MTAEAGSQPTPSAPIWALASAISCSVACSTQPPVERRTSTVFFHDADQEMAAIASRDQHQSALARPIVTEIVPASAFHSAEDYHQRYFEKHGGAVCATTLR